MVLERKWYRVIDPLSPLYGCDVLLSGEHVRSIAWAFDPEDEAFYRIVAMRRMDVIMGDRPFQLVAKKGEDLGLLISNACISSSPIQDEIIETGTDRPYGICINEGEMTRGDGYTLRVAQYEKATQIALSDSDGKLLATHTDLESSQYWEEEILRMFERGDDPDDIVYALRNN